MEIKKGIPVCPGFGIGEAFVLDREGYRIARTRVGPDEVARECERFERALRGAQEDLQHRIERFAKKAGPVAVQIFQSHLFLLQDRSLHEDVLALIRRGRASGEYAVSRIIGRRIKQINGDADPEFTEKIRRALEELQVVLTGQLIGKKREDLSHLTGGVILIARDLTVAETITLDREKILGIATEMGGPTSHTAILARALGIPAVVGVENLTTEVSGGDRVILDGHTGVVIAAPDEATLKKYGAMARNFSHSLRRQVEEQRDRPAATRDGVSIRMLANIESPGEIPEALRYGAEGIGLYRTEFLFLNRKAPPGEEEQLEEYRRAVVALGGRRIVIRTLDLGADKMHPAGFDGASRERNPFLGVRGVRLSLQMGDVLRTQLRAILRASALGDVALMYPMISDAEELIRLRTILEDAKAELLRERIPFNRSMPAGIMVEVPAVALTADQFAAHADFFSIGTNDLIQYTIAVDRINDRVAHLYRPSHPGVLRLLQGVFRAGEKAGKSVSLCGEMSGDPVYAILLLGLGLREFSVVPPLIPTIKKVIASVAIPAARETAKRALAMTLPGEIEEYLRNETRRLVPDLF